MTNALGKIQIRSPQEIEASKTTRKASSRESQAKVTDMGKVSPSLAKIETCENCFGRTSVSSVPLIRAHGYHLSVSLKYIARPDAWLGFATFLIISPDYK